VLLKRMCLLPENVKLPDWVSCVEKLGGICSLELALARWLVVRVRSRKEGEAAVPSGFYTERRRDWTATI
jgi:hypothetical protein